jgi:hypothetical protein
MNPSDASAAEGLSKTKKFNEAYKLGKEVRTNKYDTFSITFHFGSSYL